MSVLFVIGRGLLILLVVILILLALLLFVPFSYEIRGALRDPEGGEAFSFDRVREGLSGSVRISFLGPLVRGFIAYPDATDFVLRIGPVRINLSEKIRGKRDKKETDEAPDNEAQRQLDRDLEEKKKKEKEKKDGSGKKKGSAKKTARRQKLEKFLETLEGLPDAAQDKIEAWEKKADRVLRNIGFYLRLLDDPDTATALEKALRAVGKLGKHLVPKRWSLVGTAGLGDPAATGELLAVTSLLYPLTCGHVLLTPDFTLWRADLKLEARGRIPLVVVLAAALRILTDRDIRRLVGRIKHHEKKRRQQAA